jgi:nicotinic acid mononucleotide adenylyltransferase
MDFVQEHLTAILIIGGVVVFFILRDVVYFAMERKRKNYYKQHMAESEQRVDTLLKALEKDRKVFIEDMVKVDKRFEIFQEKQDDPS